MVRLSKTSVRLALVIQKGEALLDKIEWVFWIFEESREDVVLLWCPHPLMETTIAAMCPQLAERYAKVVEKYKEAGWKSMMTLRICTVRSDCERWVLWGQELCRMAVSKDRKACDAVERRYVLKWRQNNGAHFGERKGVVGVVEYRINR